MPASRIGVTAKRFQVDFDPPDGLSPVDNTEDALRSGEFQRSLESAFEGQWMKARHG